MNPTEIRAVLSELGGKPNKSLGQNFLIDKTALDAIVQAADIKKGDRVLEVGPGLGVLTRELLAREAEVTAIERDKRFGDYLGLNADGVRLVMGDAARLDWDELMGNKPWKFVSNLPYSITSLALRKALYAKRPPKVAVVLVQREVAERLMAPIRGGKLSLLSLMAALAASEMEIVRRVPPGAFWPSPKVDSAILRIVPISHAQRTALWGIEPEEVMQIAKRGFAHPRKLLFRNLGLSPEAWTTMAADLNVNEKARAEDLSVGQWVELAKNVSRSEPLSRV